MKIYIFLNSILVVSVAQAQNEIKAIPVNLQKISYIQRVPLPIARLTPRGARSCFWGKFWFVAKGESYALHLYKSNPKQGMEWSGFPGKQEFTLDVFQVVHSSKYTRINHLALNYPSSIWGVSKFGVEWFWADSSYLKSPIIKFKIWTPDGVYGDIGHEVFASFPTGLEGKATIQALQYGTWRASDTLGESNAVERTKDGAAQIRVKLYPDDDPVNLADYTFILKWNGRSFIPTAPLNDITKSYVR